MEHTTSLSNSLCHLSLSLPNSSSEEQISKVLLYPSVDDSDLELCCLNSPVKLKADGDSVVSWDDSPRKSASLSGFFPYLIHYQNQFSKLNSLTYATSSEGNVVASAKDLYEETVFEDEECEATYRALRHRESKLIFHDYVEQYLSNIELGNVVLEQRYSMIQWIVEQFDEKGLQYETAFLAVNLLDRFLSRGSFEEERDYKVLGIACLMLATKIVENQSENPIVLQNAFHVGESIFLKPEIIGMEWLVQRVLNFQCMPPTIYNFLCLYLKAVNADAMVRKTASNLALLSLLDHGILSYSPSTVAAGLVILASKALKRKSSNCRCLLNITEKVQDCVQSLTKSLKKRKWKELVDADERSYDW